MELVEQLMLLKRLSSYGLVGEIIIAIGLLIIFIYQQRKIGSLETQIKSQKGILESAEAFFKLFDLEKLKDYGEILAEKAKAEKEIEFKKIRTDLEEEIKQNKYTFEFLEKQYLVLFDAFLDFLFYLPNYVRKEIFDRMPEGLIKNLTGKVIKKLEEIDNARRKAGLIEAFLIAKKEKMIEEKNKKGGEPD